MRQRLVLAFGALLVLVVLAGCSAGGSIDMRAVNDTQLADNASREAPPLDAGPSDSADPTRADGREPLVTHAIVNGSATENSTSPRIDGGPPFEHDGAYYNVSYEVTDSREVTQLGLTVDTDPENYTGERLVYADLPAVDRRALGDLIPPKQRQVEGYDLGASVVYTDAEREESMLEPNTEYVLVYDGERYQLAVDESRETTLKTYRYEATEVAPSHEAYVQQLKDDHLFTLTGLSDAERSVVSDAIEGGYYADNDEDEAFRSVLERFRAHSAVHSEYATGEWVVRYDGQLYWAELYFGAYEE